MMPVPTPDSQLGFQVGLDNPSRSNCLLLNLRCDRESFLLAGVEGLACR
jgi:hypothetical protein